MTMEPVFTKPRGLTDAVMHYCPGCTHGITHRLVAEILEELGALDRAIGVAPVGCAVLAYEYFDCDMLQAAHGRAPAVATGVKRVHPEAVVFTYQGDGDLASIGTAEIIHAAMRGENITVIFINNAVYGMTGGQMAPTTLLGQRTATTPAGRDAASAGYPLKVAEMLATIEGAAYVARVSVHDPRHYLKARAAYKKAFLTQIRKKGFSLVEVLSNCPTNWGMSPVESLEWIKREMTVVFPLGEFRCPEGVEA